MPRPKTALAVTTRLGKAYRSWKKYEKKKDEQRDDFFTVAIQEKAKATMAQKVVALDPPLPRVEAEAYFEQYHPRWRVEDLATEDGEVVSGLLVERPEFQSYVFVNTRDGFVYQRSVTDGPAMLDDERLKKEKPDLYAKVTYTTPWGEVGLWPLDKISDDLVAQIQKFVYNGAPKVRLLAPRKATEEELAEAE